jgi:hypothetical protein
MAAEQVAAGLFEAEAAIDAALNKTAALTAALPAVRTDAGLSALYGQDVLERLTATIAALTEARRGIIDTHKELAEVKVQIGLGAVMIGASGEKPTQIGADRPSLKAVRDEVAA